MIYLGIGSNLPSKFGDRFKNINLAISHLNDLGVFLLKKSSFYETPSYPNKKNPKFINIIIKVKTNLSLKDLITTINKVEDKLLRKRKLKNEPRTCDIDIIDYNNKVLNFKYQNSVYIFPHKKLAERNFVLIPLQEISKRWKHPENRELIENLIQKLSKDSKNSILKIAKS
jgi:2-amino-4-hydroxy-6-hydroxymethyldihydropteridine diphosphokinase